MDSGELIGFIETANEIVGELFGDRRLLDQSRLEHIAAAWTRRRPHAADSHAAGLALWLILRNAPAGLRCEGDSDTNPLIGCIVAHFASGQIWHSKQSLIWMAQRVCNSVTDITSATTILDEFLSTSPAR
ncbi:MAG: hypothetical protein K2Q10_11280 [Rhodospirillales bacterium]|nr:hypothetical protein [Rhodospirillales bacterium]